MKFTKRTRPIKTSTTLSISTTAHRMELRGIDVANLSIGQPDFPPPRWAIRAAADYIEQGKFGYLPPQGILDLRKSVVRHIRSVSDFSVGPSHVLITTGAKQAIALAFQVLAEEGDEIIIPTPAWVSYDQLVTLAGAKPVFVPTSIENGFAVTARAIEEKITSKTKVIIINSPNNPTGAIIPKSELIAIAAMIDKHDLVLVSDDIYMNLDFSRAKVESVVKYIDNKDKVLSIGGVSKTYAMPGLRLGWAVGGLKLISKMKDVLSQTVSCVSGPAQIAAKTALDGSQEFLNEVRKTYKARSENICKLLLDIPGVRLVKPKGAFYVLASFEAYIGAYYKGQLIRSTKDLAHFLLTEAHVAVTPGEAFHAPGFIRFSFAISDEIINRGMERIAGFLLELTR